MEKTFIVPPEDLKDKYPELIMKCLWKLTKNLSSQVANGLDIKKLLQNIQEFFLAIPPMEWKSRTVQKLPFEDMPLKTIKTILHELTTLRGLEILSFCNSLFELESYSSVYVRTFLKSLHITIPPEMIASSEGQGKKRSRNRESNDFPEMTPSEIDNRLQDICSRICSKPDTRSV